MKLINRQNVRECALEAARTFRPAARFERVSQEFLDTVEARVRVTIIGMVKAHPTTGKTLK
jgi:hypothetical protein